MATYNSADVEMASGRTPSVTIYLNKYLPIAMLYFFFNSAGLPQGLTYCIILSPLFYLWLYSKGQRFVTLKFAVCLAPFVFAHFLNGVDSVRYYLQSTLLLWSAYITVYAFCIAFPQCRRLDSLFEQLIVLNAIVTAVALAVFVTPFRGELWNIDTRTFRGSGDTVNRLQLLNSEPAVYAVLMLPLMTYVTLRLLRTPTIRNLIYLLMIAVPYLLAQSFGGLSVYVAGVVIAMLAMHRHSLRNPRALLAVCAIVITVAGLVFIPSPISSRISQVLSGNDPSVDSRTVSSLVVAQIVVAHRSAWWGVGLGQAKLVDLPAGGLAFTRAVIPNSVAATYAELGIVGVVLRISLELYLFFHTRVYDNSFRLAMFTAAFFMQFTGGFIEETREYIIWGFAFCSFFPEFSLRRAARPVSH